MVTTMSASNILALPVIHGEVPVMLESNHNEVAAYAELLQERVKAGLSWTPPDASQHENLRQAFRSMLDQHMQRLHRDQNWPRWEPSNNHLVVDLCTDFMPYADSEQELCIGNHFGFNVDGGFIHLGAAIRKLERHQRGLGLQMLKELDAVNAPGVNTESDALTMHLNQVFELWGELSSTLSLDADALSRLESIARAHNEEHECCFALPSVLLAEAQLLDVLGKPTQYKKCRGWERVLTQAGVPEAKALAELIAETIPRWQAIIHQIRGGYRNEGFTHDQNWMSEDSFAVITARDAGDPVSAATFIEGSIDDEYRMRMEVCAIPLAFAVDRVHKEFQNVDWESEDGEFQFETYTTTDTVEIMGQVIQSVDRVDGLALTGAQLGLISALDRIITLLMQYGETP